VGRRPLRPARPPESNVTAVDDVLLGGAEGELGSAPLPTANIIRSQRTGQSAGTTTTKWCAARYAEEMAAQLPLADGNWPVFDLILVGVGDDGHLLSVFPGSPALDSFDWTMGIPRRRTLGPHIPRVTINPATTGSGTGLSLPGVSAKQKHSATSSAKTRDDRRWPVQRTRRPGAAWIVDEAAAGSIPGDRKG